MIIKKIIVISLLLTFSEYIYSDKIVEFNNKPIKDILLALGDLSGINIIPDETITGNTSFYFTTEDLGEALDLFNKSHNIYLTSLSSAYLASKIYLKLDDNRVTLKCKNCSITTVINTISDRSNITIINDIDDNYMIDINIKDLTIESTLNIILAKITGYELKKNSDFYQIKPLMHTDNNMEIIKDKSTLYRVNMKKVRFSTVIEELFYLEGLEYLSLCRNDNIINNLSYSNKTFFELLNIILESGHCDYTISNGVYYIFDLNHNEISNRHLETKIIKLKNLTTTQLLKIIPSSLISNNTIKTYDEINSVIIYGTKIKTEPIYNFINLVDVNTDKKPRWIKLNFISTDLFKELISKKFNPTNFMDVDNKSLIIMLDDMEYEMVTSLKTTIDIPPESFPITLNYITSDDLLTNLPKSINESQIIRLPNPSRLLFYGDKRGYDNISKVLKNIDKPVPQIKYKLLVLQNSVGDDFNFGLDITGDSADNGEMVIPDGDWNSFSGSLYGLLSLNFNFLSAFGPLFSFELNASLKNNRSSILVDTTLQALSGKKASFRNTTTSRFYQTTIDSDGNSEVGAAQEVSWGIILDIDGWTSGDGMVTVIVNSTISDETQLTGENSGIPSTSEKIVNTEVRTREGEPIVISGLLSSKKEVNYNKIPLLGDIPYLGHLFSHESVQETKSEFTIYLIPYVEDNPGIDLDNKLGQLYREIID